jgi:exopolysaccharide/PEP-CTERM locus tyrosine autokinase
LGYIDKALEKAKASRERTPNHQAPQPSGVTLAEIASSTPLAGQIQYTSTRTVPVRLEALQRQRIIVGDFDHLVLEEYKILRTQILQRTKADRKNTLMITGPSVGEGKTLTAINLAISLAQEVDKTVLLVDADLRHPSIAELFGLPKGPGLVDYLSGSSALSELLVHPQGFDRLVILPGGRAVPGAAELIGSPVMAELVAELKGFYPDRYVLFDLPPVLPFADTLAFAPLVDGIILVVEMGKSSRENIEKSVKILKDFPILGFVLNKVEMPDQRSYPYYGDKNGRLEGKKGLLRWVKF